MKSTPHFSLESIFSNSLRFSKLQNSTTRFLCVALMMMSFAGWGQTNPAAYDLSTGSFSFTSQTATSTIYPTNIQGWATSANNITAAETVAPGLDQTLVASGTATTSGLSNLGSNGFQFLSTSNTPNRRVGSIALAIKTTGRQSITLNWTAQDMTASSTGTSMGLSLQYRLGTSGAFTDFGASGLYTTSSSSQTAAQNFTSIVLPSTCNNQTVVQIRWIYYQIGATGNARDAVRLDDISVSSTVMPACSGTPSPGNTLASVNPVAIGSSALLSLQNIVGLGATYQWQSSSNNSSWADISGGTSATYSATPSAATYYRCNVTCSGNTGASNSLLVNLTYCTSTGTGTRYISNVTSSGGISNISNNTGTTLATSGYGDYSSTSSCSQYQNTALTLNVSTNAGFGTGISIFIDWNNNFLFTDVGELVSSTNGSYTTLSPWISSFTIPSSQAVGNYRMRIVNNYNSSTPVSCNSSISGETEDYTLTVVALPACSAPTSLAATASTSAQTTTTVAGSFTAASSAPTAYLVVRTDSNSQPSPLTGTTYTVGSNAIGYIEYVGSSAGSWTSTSLSPGTTYYYWVFSYNNTNCTGGPVYSASTTNFSTSTVSCPGTSLSGLTYATNPAGYCLSAAISTNVATLSASAGNITYSVSPALPSGLTLSNSTGSISGTPTALVASTNYTVTADNGCTNTTATLTITTNALPATPASSAATLAGTYGFTANWTASAGATAYFLDVSTSSLFTSMVSGYDGLNVGDVTIYGVTGLGSGTTYYYRVRSTNGTCNSLNSTSQTIATTALTSVATGDWNSASTWSGGQVPTCNDNVTIVTGNTVTVNSSSNVSKNTTINSGGTLTIASGDLTVGCTLNNTPLTNNGTLTVTGGTLNVNGNISSALGSTFNQSGGEINIDGNNGGSTTGSVASGTPLLNLLQLNSGINWTGGTLTIVDPHTATTNTNGYALFYSNNTAGTNYPSVNHTIQFGNGISTDAGGNTSGFFINHWELTAGLPFGSCVINGPSGTNRSIFYAYSPQVINGNLTVNSGGNINVGSFFTIGQNLTVNSGGTFINAGTTQLAITTSNTGSSFTYEPSTSSQTIGGSGNFQNSATITTANLASLTVNNSNATGVTLSAPMSISGTLTMTAGKINTTSTNLLTLGTATAAGTLAYTAGQITGPFARTFATSSSTTAVYDGTTLFPVGDGTNYIPIHIDPVNGGGVVRMSGQAFNTNSGTGGTGVASVLSTDRWEALVTSGTITDCFIGLNDAQIADGNIIAQSSSANGTYNAISGASTFVSGTPNALRTAVQIPNASYSGFFTYAAPGPVITSFTPTSICPGTVGTITITGTNLGSATAVTLNGETCTVTANSATSLTFTTDATPQAGNIVVTTAANSATSATAVSLYTLPTVTALASSNDPITNNTICSGSTITLNGGGATSYVWNNGVSNSTSFTPIATNTYTVTGTDVNGCVNMASITITVNNAVSISSQPVNAVVLPNTDATFSVSATGTGLTYQWEENTGSAWSSITNGGIYSGATTNTLTLTNVSAGSGNQYRCVISGTTPCAAATSSVVTLTISLTAITAQPQNQSICLSSGTASFSVTTTGSTPTYQWQLSTNSGSSWSDITGEISATLSLSNLTLLESGNLYHCVLNNTITSSNALLTVSPVSVAGTVSSNQVICSGSTPSSITLSGNTGSIQWQVSTDNTSFIDISGATTSTLAASTIGALTSTRYYRAVVTSGGCSAATSGVVTVTVTPTPNAGTLSGTQVVCANSTSSFTSNGDAGGAWTSANTAVATVNISTGVVSGVAAGVTTITYTITGTGGCTTTTATRTVTVNAVPPITSATATPAAVCAGETVSLSAESVAVSTGTSIASGSGTSTTSSYPTPFGNDWWGAKQQFIITAADLSAMGLIAGNITAVSFDITSVSTTPLVNYTISAKHTTSSAFTTSYLFETGLSQLYTTTSYTPSSNTGYSNNKITFGTPFNWNGTSNVVFEICFNNSAWTSNATSSYTTKSYYTSAFYYDDLSSICNGTYASAISYNLPNMKFDGQIGTNNTSNFTWAWNTTPAVTAATGTTTAVNNTSSPATQTYNVTATAASTGCSSTATTSAITINPTLATPTANSTTVCGPQNATCSVTGSGISGNTFKWYTVPTGGTPITGQTGASLSAYLVSATTTFYVSETNANCEGARVAVVQTISTPPSVTAAITTTPICAGQSTSLSVSSTNSSYTYSWNNNAGSGATVTVTPSATTTYTVTATDASGGAYDGCAALATATVTVNPLPTAVTLTPSSAAFCNGVSSAQSLVASFVNQTVAGENFNNGVGTFTVTSSSSSTNQNWTAQSNGYVYSSETFSGSTNGFMMANSDVGGYGATTNTTLTSPSFSTVGYSSLSLSISEFLNNATATAAAIEISNDNFVSNITELRNDILNDFGTASSFNATAISIPSSYENLSNVKIRFRYVGGYDWWWAVDEFLVSGTQLNPITWSPTNTLYTDAAAATAYTGTSATTVYALPTTTTTYTATATSAAGCTSSNTVAITVNQPSVAPTGISGTTSICIGASTTLTATGGTLGTGANYEWGTGSVVGTNPIAGQTSASITVTPTTTTTYWVRIVNATSPCTATTSGVSAAVTVDPLNTWIGGNGNWSDPNNWCGGVPTSSTAVVIANNATITLNAGAGNTTEVASMTINSGATLVVATGEQLTLTGALVNNGAMIIETGGTFKQGTSVTGNGTYNVQQYLTGSNTGNVLDGRFWYMGVPLNVTRTSGFGDETTTNRAWTWSETGQAYSTVPNANVLTPTTGIVYRRGTNGTISFNGSGASGTGLYAQDATLTGLTKTGATFSGYHLLANPYTAYLDFEMMNDVSNNMSSTIWTRAANSANSMDFDTYNATSNLGVNPSGGTSNQFIAPMQAFWVRVAGNTGTTGNISMTRAMTSHNSTYGGLKSGAEYPAFARVNVVDGPRYDQTLVYLRDDQNNAVDAFDSEKMFASGLAQVYTMAVGKKLVMNGLKNNKKRISVPLYFDLPTSKVYELTLAEFNMENGIILLEDKQEGIIQDFTINDHYAFYASSGTLNNRFVLHFYMPEVFNPYQAPSNNWANPEPVEGGIFIGSDGRGKVLVELELPSETQPDHVQILNAAGQVIFEADLNGAQTEFDLEAATGIYLVKVTNGSTTEIKKIIIQH